MLIQFTLTAFLLIALAATWQRRGRGMLSGSALLGWSVLWCGGIIVVWWPALSSTVATFFGVGRGSDLVVYFLLLFLCYAMFRQTLRMEELDRHITKLVRILALQNEKKDK